MEKPKEEAAPSEPAEPSQALILHLPLARGNTPKREPPATDAEIREYRRIRPQLLAMLREWERVRSMCPMASRIVGEDGD